MTMKKELKWKTEFLEHIKNCNNEQLLEDTLNLAGGDDYDGCFTNRGEWMYNKLLTELYRRLNESGFIKES